MNISLTTSPPLPPSAQDMKLALRLLAGGVSVVTTGFGAARTGATVTSAQSFSVDPPVLTVSLNRGSSTWLALREAGVFCVNILAASQRGVAERFAGIGGIQGPARYDGAEWITLATGAQALVGALAVADCEVEEIVERHSHALIFGRVRALKIGAGAPLIYAEGGYARLA